MSRDWKSLDAKLNSNWPVYPSTPSADNQTMGSELMLVTISTLKGLLDVVKIDPGLLHELQSLDTIIVKKMCDAVKGLGRTSQPPVVGDQSEERRPRYPENRRTSLVSTGSLIEVELKEEESLTNEIEDNGKLLAEESSVPKKSSSFKQKGRSNIQILHYESAERNERYRCSLCSYTSRYAATIQLHIQTHTGDKPYKCKYCSYASNAAYKVKEHTRSHLGIKPYECQFCDLKLTRRIALNRHLIAQHGYKAYRCTVCEFAATDYPSLRSHYVANHPGVRIKRLKVKNLD